MTDRLRVAVIGAGMMGRFHASAARRNGAVVTAVADIDIARAQSLADAAGTSARVISIDALFEARDVEAIHICTPPDSHLALSMRAVNRGMHVLCEKPVAETAGEVERLLERGAAQNRIVCPVHQFPFQNGVQRMLASRGRIGTVRHVSGTLCSAGAEGVPDVSRQAVALNILPHPLSLFRAFTTRPLASAEWNVAAVSPGEFVLTGVLAEGIGVSFVVSTLGRPTRNTLQVIGDAGTASFDLFHGFSIYENGRVSRFRKLTRPFAESGLTIGHATFNGLRRVLSRETAFPGLSRLVQTFYAAIVEGNPSPILPEELLDIARARDRIISLFPR